MPSRVDNYPNACLEALSLGVPVIGTYDSSLDEMIEFLGEDELLEVTPLNLRIRKRILDSEERGKQVKKAKELMEE
jgi:predicted membrane GTPase involved in stress response